MMKGGKAIRTTNVVLLLFSCSVLFFFPFTSYAQPKNGSTDLNSNVKEISNGLLHIEVLPQDGMKEKDRITQLSGQPCKVNFEQYGGYVTVNQKHGRALFYYFVEADASIKDSAPLIFWFNGGPGCSSLGIGAFEEMGPFRVKSDGKTLYENVYAWNKVANILFLESPAGVGFSYTNTTSDIAKTDDRRVAHDSYIFLLNWLERFPEYKNRDFYITGESYAGHYIPQLATIIIQNNQLHAQNNNTLINLKGIAIGNGNFDNEIEEAGKFEYFWGHGFVSDRDIKTLRENCDFNVPLSDRKLECTNLTGAIAEELMGTTRFNVYNIYAPMCLSPIITETPKEASLTNIDPCVDMYVNYYLNSPEVQLALHANVTKINRPWAQCTDDLMYVTGQTVAPSMIPLLKKILDTNIRVLIYSGDLDSSIAYVGTRNVVRMLNLKEVIPWSPWMVNDEIAGQCIAYEGGLTFTTIRGSGHMVPSDKPEVSLVMIKAFLKGENLPLYVKSK